MHFDDLINVIDSADISELIVPDNWAQGRTVYGGLSAALIYQKMQAMVQQDKTDEIRPVRYLNYSFIGPLMTNAPISIEVDLLRAGRSATQLMAKVKQQGEICIVAQGCFGIKRKSKLQSINKKTHNMSIPKKGNFLPQIPKIVPKFLRHFELSLQQGRLPFMHSKKDYLHGWMRFKKQPSEFNDAHLIAAIDAWPCTVLQQLKLPAPASTMNWNIEFPQNSALPKANDWIAYQAHTEHASDGYVFSDAQLWNADGGLLALSRQTVGVFG